MDDNLAIIVLLTIAIAGAVALVFGTRLIRARQTAALQTENKQLTAQVASLTNRLAALETIATDPGTRIAHEIEQLR